MKSVIFRQGDVLLKKIKELPENVAPAKDKILAYGEVTGHKHQFLQEQVLVFEKEGKKFVKNNLPICELVHEEHDVLKIPKGVFEVVLQREYDVLEGVKKVMD